jgi:hypothetical protein
LLPVVAALVSRRPTGGTTLELGFDTLELRTTCERAAEAQGALGSRVAGALQRRIADVRAAARIGDLIAGNPRILEDHCPPVLVIDLIDDWRLVLSANHKKLRHTATGAVDWNAVMRVKVLRIEASHGD